MRVSLQPSKRKPSSPLTHRSLLAESIGKLFYLSLQGHILNCDLVIDCLNITLRSLYSLRCAGLQFPITFPSNLDSLSDTLKSTLNSCILIFYRFSSWSKSNHSFKYSHSRVDKQICKDSLIILLPGCALHFWFPISAGP